jgi:hypothetical protein
VPQGTAILTTLENWARLRLTGAREYLGRPKISGTIQKDMLCFSSSWQIFYVLFMIMLVFTIGNITILVDTLLIPRSNTIAQMSMRI